MSWEEELFAYLDDLEGQAAALFDADRGPEVADRGREQYQTVSLAGRLMAGVGEELTLELAGVGPITGVLTRVAKGWCLLQGRGQDWVVRLGAVYAAYGASMRAVPEIAWPASARLGLGAALRRLAEAAEPCAIYRTDGCRHDGIVTRVGADFIEVDAGAARRKVLVAIERLAAVQSRPDAQSEPVWG